MDRPGGADGKGGVEMNTCHFNNPAIKRVRRGQWRLQDDLIFSYLVNGCWQRIIVPAGFESNLASVPWWMWWIFPPVDDYFFSVILHDYLYTGATSLTRGTADAFMREAMIPDGVSPFRRRVMYYGVRLFGACWWKGVPG
jgi:hypothetical protein